MNWIRTLLQRLNAFSRGPQVALILVLLAVAITIASLINALRRETYQLRVTAGDRLGRRHEIAEVLEELASEQGVDLEILPTAGSAEALELVSRRELDLALVQGGLPAPASVREVASVVDEPLHLLVKDASIESLRDLRARSVDISPPGSGTRALSLEVLAFFDMHPERDFSVVSFDYDELESKPYEQLPDAVFHVTAMPSPVAEFLVRRHGYHVIPLPYAAALGLRNQAIRQGTIQAFAYRGHPAEPPEDVETIATRMMVVAHRETDAAPVRELLEILASEEFWRAAHLPRRSSSDLLASPELRLHRGSEDWLHRHDPLLTPSFIDNLESMRSFFVSLAVALFLGWRWWRARRQRGFDHALHEVTKLEREVLRMEIADDIELARLHTIQRRLGDLKNKALQSYGAGSISSVELLHAFLAHVTDVRAYLHALILHTRDHAAATEEE